MYAVVVGAVVFVVTLLGAYAGWLVGQRHPLSDEAKTWVMVTTGVIATVAALSLGLLLSNANTAFTTRNNDVTRLSAEIIRLDRLLSRYGPDAIPARNMLRQYVVQKAADLFPEDSQTQSHIDNESTYDLLFDVEESVLGLHPDNPRDQWIVTQAMTNAAYIGNTQWLFTQQEVQGTSPAFLILVTFWLALLFASFGLFAPRKTLSAVILVLCALAVSGAVEMVLDLQRPFGGFNRISPQPMRNAVNALTNDGPSSNSGSPGAWATIR